MRALYTLLKIYMTPLNNSWKCNSSPTSNNNKSNLIKNGPIARQGGSAGLQTQHGKPRPEVCEFETASRDSSSRQTNKTKQSIMTNPQNETNKQSSKGLKRYFQQVKPTSKHIQQCWMPLVNK